MPKKQKNASQATDAVTAVKKVSAKAAAKAAKAAAAAAAAVVDTDEEGSAEAPQRRRHRWRRGTVALRSIRREQKKSEKMALRAAPFERVVRAAAQKYSFSGGDDGTGVRFTHKAIKALQEATEMHLHRQFTAAHAVTLYSGRLMLDVKDFALADYVRGDSHSFLLRGESVGE